MKASLLCVMLLLTPAIGFAGDWLTWVRRARSHSPTKAETSWQ